MKTVSLALLICFGAILDAQAGINEWTYVGLAPEDITSVAVDPTNADIIYAAAVDIFWDETREGGLFKTTDHGVTWDTVGFRHSHVYDVAIDPGDPQVLWVADWVDGVWQSTNAGQTWESRSNGLYLGGPDDSGVHSIDVSPDNPAYLLCSVQEESGPGRGYRTSDMGQTWTIMAEVGPSAPRFIEYDQQQVGLAYLMHSQPALWRSIDGGESFQSTPPMEPFGLYDFRLSPTQPGELWWASRHGGVWVSQDSGQSWQSHITRFVWPDTVIWMMSIGGGGDTALFVTSNEPFLSLDGGNNLIDLQQNLDSAEAVDRGWLIGIDPNPEAWIFRRNEGLWTSIYSDSSQSTGRRQRNASGEAPAARIYPNPSGGSRVFLNLSATISPYAIRLYDVLGRLVTDLGGTQRSSRLILNIPSTLPNGTYFVVLFDMSVNHSTTHSITLPLQIVR